MVTRDNRNLSGKTCTFDTHGIDSKLAEYRHTKCIVLYRISESKYDFDEVGSMWMVQMPDGVKVEAFADELEIV